MIFHILRNPHILKGYRLQKVNHIEFTSITAKIISRKCTCKELLRKSAFLVRKKIEELLLYCFVSCNFFLNIKISHEHKVYLNIKMNLTPKLNISFTLSVTLGLYCFCKNVEFLAKCLTNLLAVLL